MEVFATIFAGLGLFIVGVKLIGTNLKQLGGRRIRTAVRRSVGNPVSAAFSGMMIGALTQSTSGATFIAAGLATAGLVPVAQAIPLVVWSNVGTSLLVLLAAVDIKLLVLCLLGLAGTCFFAELDRHPRLRHLVGALLGTGLLFLGLQLLKQGAAPLRDFPVVVEFVEFAGESAFLGFLVGCLVTVVLQSSATTTVIAVTLAGIGLLAFEQAVMLVYGASLGSGIANWFLSAPLRGTARRLANLQLAVKALGVAILVPLSVIETEAGLPLVAAAARWFGHGVAQQVALIYLATQLVSAGAATLAAGPLWRLIERLTPDDAAETLSRPRFLYDEALDDPTIAADLLIREQDALLARAPHYLDGVRSDAIPSLPPLVLLHPATLALSGEIARFSADLLERAPPQDVVAALVRLQNRHAAIDGLLRTVRELAIATATIPTGTIGPSPTHALIEALHLLLDTAATELATGDRDGRALVVTLAGDRSTMMDRLRRRLLSDLTAATPAVQAALFGITSLFERAVWLIRQVALLSAAADSDDASQIATELAEGDTAIPREI